VKGRREREKGRNALQLKMGAQGGEGVCVKGGEAGGANGARRHPPPCPAQLRCSLAIPHAVGPVPREARSRRLSPDFLRKEPTGPSIADPRRRDPFLSAPVCCSCLLRDPFLSAQTGRARTDMERPLQLGPRGANAGGQRNAWRRRGGGRTSCCMSTRATYAARSSVSADLTRPPRRR
jgi:hypothetical protein